MRWLARSAQSTPWRPHNSHTLHVCSHQLHVEKMSGGGCNASFWHNHLLTPSATTDHEFCGLATQHYQFPGDHATHILFMCADITCTPRRRQEVGVMPRSAQNHFLTPSATKDHECCGLPAERNHFPDDNITHIPFMCPDISCTPRRRQEVGVMPRSAQNHFLIPSATTDHECCGLPAHRNKLLATKYLTYPSCVLTSHARREEDRREV